MLRKVQNMLSTAVEAFPTKRQYIDIDTKTDTKHIERNAVANW